MTVKRAKVSDFLDEGKFKCVSCGACCSYIKPLAENGRLPPNWAKSDGSCIHLNEEKKCLIYSKRPNVCRVDIELRPTRTDIEIAEMCTVIKNFVDGV